MWTDILECHDTQKAYTIFHTKLLACFNQSFPQEVIHIKYKTKYQWITPAIQNSIKYKNKLYIKYKKYPTSKSEHNYKAYKKYLANILHYAEQNYYDQLFAKYKSNMKKSWQLLKNIISANRKHKFKSTKFKINNISTDDNCKIANHFNSYFVNVGSSLDKKIPNCDKNPEDYITNRSIATIFLEPVIDQEIVTISKNAKASSPEWDDIPMLLIKLTVVFWSHLLT